MANHTEYNLLLLLERVFKKQQGPLLVTVGKVSNIDESKRICDISIDEDITLSNCRLNAIIDSYENHLLIVPKNNSMVAFITVGGKLTEPLIIAYSEIEKVLLTIGESDILIEDGKIEMNGGNLGGLIKLQQLESNLDKLKKYVEDLATMASSAMAPMAALDGGASVATFNTNWGAMKATFSFDDMEDTKITH